MEKRIPNVEQNPNVGDAASIEEEVRADVEKREVPSDEKWGVLVKEMTVYLSSYVGAKIDGAKLAARESFFSIAFEVMAFLVLKSVLIIAVAFSMYGIAAGLGKAFGEDSWLAYLLTGIFFVLAVGFSFKLLWAMEKRRSLKMKVREYEEELEAQRAKFGHDAVWRASAPPK